MALSASYHHNDDALLGATRIYTEGISPSPFFPHIWQLTTIPKTKCSKLRTPSWHISKSIGTCGGIEMRINPRNSLTMEFLFHAPQTLSCISEVLSRHNDSSVTTTATKANITTTDQPPRQRCPASLGSLRKDKTISRTRKQTQEIDHRLQVLYFFTPSSNLGGCKAFSVERKGRIAYRPNMPCGTQFVQPAPSNCIASIFK